MSAKSVNEIVDLASAFYSSAVLFAALDAGVFAALEKTPGAGADAVAAALGASPRGTRLLLDACVACGLLEKSPSGGYSNTKAASLSLVPGASADLTKAIRYNRDVYPAWGRLAELVATGRPVESPKLHLGGDPARTKAFADSMFGRAMAIGQGVVPMLGKLEGRLLDLAGGPGAYAILACRSNPSLRATTVDLPAISAAAADYVERAGLSSRIECRAGDYHKDEFEAGSYDAATIFGALHQESPSAIVDILKRANRALKPGGKIFILDMMTDETHVSPPFSALFAVNMALTTENGWVFSDAELKDCLSQAGFDPGETLKAPAPMPHWLVSAAKRNA